VELKTFTFTAGSKLISIDSGVLGPISKHLLFTMLKNTDFLGSIYTNPYEFRHYGFKYLAMYFNGKQIPSDGLSLDMDHKNTSVMAYRTLFEGTQFCGDIVQEVRACSMKISARHSTTCDVFAMTSSACHSMLKGVSLEFFID
jgi:hypothetical protein